jgi:hypothetical protein
MEKFKQLWSDWRGTIGFIGGALVVSTSFFTCSVEPNKEAIKEVLIETEVKPAESEKSEELPAEDQVEQPES